MHCQCHILLYLPVCHGEHPQAQSWTLWLISRSHTASTPLPSSIRKQQLCLWLQQSEPHQSTIQNHFKLSRSCSPPPTRPSSSQRLFFSHYFLVDPQIASTVTFKVQQSVNMIQYVLFSFWSFGCSGLLIDNFSKILTFAAGLRVHLGYLNVLS